MYIPNLSKKAIVNRLKKAAAKADEIILATDEDREGEAISWHLLQVRGKRIRPDFCFLLFCFLLFCFSFPSRFGISVDVIVDVAKDFA